MILFFEFFGRRREARDWEDGSTPVQQQSNETWARMNFLKIKLISYSFKMYSGNNSRFFVF